MNLTGLTLRTTRKFKGCALLPLYSVDAKFPALFWSCPLLIPSSRPSFSELSDISLWFPICKNQSLLGFLIPNMWQQRKGNLPPGASGCCLSVIKLGNSHPTAIPSVLKPNSAHEPQVDCSLHSLNIFCDKELV